MNLLRQEIRNYVRACEAILSNRLEPRLTEEEQELIRYYVNGLSGKFNENPITAHGPSFHAARVPRHLSTQGGEGRLKLHAQPQQLEQGILNAVVIGEFELAAAEIEFIELLDEAVRSGSTKVLIDGHQMTGNPEDFERFLYGEFAAWATLETMRERNTALKFAYVIHEPSRDRMRFGENVAVNRGMNVKTFEDAKMAIQWLNAA